MAGDDDSKKEEAAAPAAGDKAQEDQSGDVSGEKIDVSKPVARPDKAAFDAKIAALNNEVAVFTEKISGVDAKITDAKSSGGDQSDELREARATMKSLRERKDAVMRDRAEIAAKQKAARASLEQSMQKNKQLRSEMKYTSGEEIEKRISELERKQSTTSMSLKDEKSLLKEIEQLKQSKKFVVQLTTNNDTISEGKKSSASISEQLSSKNAELDVLKKKIDEQKEILEGLNTENSERRAVLPALFKERDALRKEKQAKVDEIKALRTEFRAAEKKYYDHQREVYRLRKEAKKQEEDARRAEYEARQKELEAEELKRIPYEEEMELCKFLIDYLEKTYLAKAGEAPAPAPAAPVTAGEFEGMVLAGKKTKVEDEYVSLNMGKKKGRGKKKGGLKVQDKLIIAPETIEIFGNLALEPPATVSAVPATIEALKAKGEWFKTLERGAIQSIREKRKAEEKASRGRGDREDRGDKEDKPKPKKEGKAAKSFNAAAKEEELFPALPGSSAPKVVPPPPAVDEPADEGKAE